MTFTTIQFLLFFAVVFPLFFLTPGAWRRPLLLVASYYFYMCSVPWYITVIIAITLIDFSAAIALERARTPGARRLYLILSIVSNFGLLFAFKYCGFFLRNVNGLFGLGMPVLQFILPVGISFHTFQAVSYVIEVYRGTVRAERNLLNYALYVAFFPQMVAGPIERPYNLLPQFRTHQVLRFEDVQSGLRMVLWGLFKKAVVADLLGVAVATVYSQPRQFSGPILALGTFFFSVQIYCDFSGYSDIAIGIARMMGFRLMVNFRQPYFARSMSEFWRRWHISLSTWFRDYVYIPLGGSRVTKYRFYVNVIIVFLLSGFWHGANWTFVVWGGLHGTYLIVGAATATLRTRIKRLLGLDNSAPGLAILQALVTFSLVTVAWVFFRAANVRDAAYIVSHLLDFRGFRFVDLFSLGLPRFEMMLSFALCAAVGVTEWCIAVQPSPVLRLWTRPSFRWAVYNACLFAVIFFGVFQRVQFIYFQF